MSLYAIIVNKDTGIPVFTHGYKQNEFPPDSVIQPDQQLVTFDESVPNFDIIHAILFGDPDRIAINYLLANEGGIKFNFDTKELSIHEIDISIDINALRSFRDQLIASTDKYMLIPDLPIDIKNDLIAYRQILRDATAKVGKEWKTVYDVQWPEFPQKLLPRPVIPVEPPVA